MLTLLQAVATVTAAATDPAVTPATTDKVVNWAIQAPLTVAFFLLLIAIGYIGRWVIKDAFPKWLDEQEKSRQLRVDENEKTRAHFEKLSDKRSEDAVKDVASAHAEIGERVDAVHEAVAGMSGKVDRVDGRLEKIDAKVDGVHAFVRALASKQGLGTLLLLVGLSCLAAFVGVRIFRTATASYTCDPKCEAPEYCCETDVCCRNAAARLACPKPHSDLVVRYDYGDDPWAEQDHKRTSL